MTSCFYEENHCISRIWWALAINQFRFIHWIKQFAKQQMNLELAYAKMSAIFSRLQSVKKSLWKIAVQCWSGAWSFEPLLLTWFNFNPSIGAVKVWEWIINFISHFTRHAKGALHVRMLLFEKPIKRYRNFRIDRVRFDIPNREFHHGFLLNFFSTEPSRAMPVAKCW